MIQPFHFLMIVDDPDIASFVWTHGVNTLFVDLEKLGKHERQAHVASWKSSQTIKDVAKIRQAVPEAELLTRIDPLNENSAEQIEAVISCGTDAIMLPMFRTAAELEQFFDLVDGRAEVVPLFETQESLSILQQDLPLLRLLKRAHIGLNDLHLDMGRSFMFDPLADGTLERPCQVLKSAGISFGIGGIARAKEGIVGPEHLLGEHFRLGSTAAILSRTFHRSATTLAELQASTDFGGEIASLREIYDNFACSSPALLEKNRVQTIDRISEISRLIAGRQSTASASHV